MRLIIPLLIILLGTGCGVLVCTLFKHNAKHLKISALLGGLGSFIGLMLRDILDDTSGGLLGGAFLYAIIGAPLLAAAGNVFIRLSKA